VRAESGAAAQRSGDALDDVRGAWRAASPSWRTRSTGCPSGSRRSRATAPARRRRCCQGLDATVRRLPAVLAARDEQLLASLRADREQAARDRETTQELALAVRGTLDALSSALVDEDARAARQRAALEAGWTASAPRSRPSWRASAATSPRSSRRRRRRRRPRPRHAPRGAHDRGRDHGDGAAGAARRAAHSGHRAARAGLVHVAEATTSAATAVGAPADAHAASEALRRDLDELGSGMVSATGELVSELRARSAREASTCALARGGPHRLRRPRRGARGHAVARAARHRRGGRRRHDDHPRRRPARDGAHRADGGAARRGRGLLREVRADVLDAGRACGRSC
jgi:hypothetical protein